MLTGGWGWEVRSAVFKFLFRSSYEGTLGAQKVNIIEGTWVPVNVSRGCQKPTKTIDKLQTMPMKRLGFRAFEMRRLRHDQLVG